VIRAIDNGRVITFVIWAAAVVALDQIAKLIVIRGVGERSFPLGPFGELRIISTQMWLMRGPRVPHVATIWMVWLSSAIGLAVASAAFPHIGSVAGLLVGGSLAHAIETSRHGKVSDYICLRFWPAFDLADIALAIGAGGFVLQLPAWIRTVV
jgi:signal peptidase II